MYIQNKGVDVILSPAVIYTSIRVVLLLAVYFKIQLEKINVKNAFLYGQLEEYIYM